MGQQPSRAARPQLQIRRPPNSFVASSSREGLSASSAALEASLLPFSAPFFRSRALSSGRIARGSAMPGSVAFIALGVRQGPLKHNAGSRAAVAFALRPHYAVLRRAKGATQIAKARRERKDDPSELITARAFKSIKTSEDRRAAGLRDSRRCNSQTSRRNLRQKPCRPPPRAFSL